MSRIEQIIGDIEEYIESCKYQPLSNTKIIVNKEELEELLVELRLRVPDEIKKYQKIVSQQEAIIQDAKVKADGLINDARQQTEEMVNENEVIKLAYQKAQEMVDEAQAQADDIIQKASNEAMELRMGAVQYTDGLLADFEKIVKEAAEEEENRFKMFQEAMGSTLSQIADNRKELNATGFQEEKQ